MKTGKNVKQNGLYASDCCVAEAALQKDQSFPRCPKCMNLTLWLEVRGPVNKGKKAA